MPSAALVARISSAPSGSPWTLWELALFGLPLPMVVWQRISCGFVLAGLVAACSAARTDAKS
jgi:hypothetical protein